MMNDLLVGGSIMAALTVGLFLLTRRAIRRLPPRTLNLLGVLLLLGLAFYIQNVWYHVELARWLPVPSLIIVGNWLPLFAAPLAAVAWHSVRQSSVRRVVLCGSLLATGGLALVYPVLGRTPRCGNAWDKTGTCLQTTRLTCSPACAATLLVHHGIDATEQEMAELCLTRQGTSWQGLYRGLKLKTAGTPWDVEVFACTSGELMHYAERPVILSVGLASDTSADTDYTREFGWVPGVNHSVILTGFKGNGLATIADPSLDMGREQWDGQMLRTLWRGYGIRLVRRQ